MDAQQFARCEGCDAHVATPFPDLEDLETFYREQYYGIFGEGEGSPRRRAMLRSLVETIPRQPPGHLLDVGCGAGHLLAVAREAGWDVTGVDPSADACVMARREYGLDVQAAPFEAADLPEAAFDVITLVNVLDQVSDPVRLLETARRALRPAGLLVARIPNGDFHRTAWAVIRRLPSTACRRLHPFVIFHPFCLNARAVRALLEGARLTRIHVTSAPTCGPEWPLPGGPLGRAVQAGLASAARATSRLFYGPSLLAISEREVG